MLLLFEILHPPSYSTIHSYYLKYTLIYKFNNFLNVICMIYRIIKLYRYEII